MKLRFLFSLMLGASLAAGAQGYHDGVDNYNAGRKDIAKEILMNTLNAPSTDKAIAYYYLGCIDFDNNNIAEAKANFEKGIAANPEYPYNYIGEGEVVLKSGDKSSAQKLFDQAMKFDKKNTAVIATVARAYWNVDPVAYKKDIDKYISKALKDSKNTESAVYMLQGDMVAKTDPGEAAGLYEMAITQDKSKGVVNREAYVKYANVYTSHNRDLLISMLEELNELEPESGLAQRELAEVYYNDGKYAKAWKCYEKYVQNPNHFRRDEQRYVAMLYTIGTRMNDNSLFNEAILWSDKVLAQDPSIYQMYRMKMLSYNKIGEDSLAMINGDILFKTPDAELLVNDYGVYGDLLVRNGRVPEAIALLEKVISENPDDEKAIGLMPELGNAYTANGEIDKAVEIQERYLQSDNVTAQDCYNMFLPLFNKGRETKDPEEQAKAFNAAKKYIDYAIEKAPEHLPYIMQALWLSFFQNNGVFNADGIAIADRMLELTDGATDATAREYRFRTYYLLARSSIFGKEYETAKDYCNKALEIVPDNESVLKLLEDLNN